MNIVGGINTPDRRSVLLFVVLVAMSAGTAFGQAETTGRVAGRVVDESGEPIGEARVTLISPVLQGERKLKTDARGEFLTALLPIGSYAISVEVPGKKTAHVTLRVAVGQTDPLTFVLEPGNGPTEKVTVYASERALKTTVIGENFNYDEQVDNLPIVLRDLENVALYSANVTGRFPERGITGRYIAIAGATQFDNATLLDGAELTDNLGFVTRELFLEDAVEELQVQTAGVSARYGRFSGGVLNAITKSGGNTFSGTVRAQFSREDWNARTPFGEVQSDELSEVYQGTLGGYMVKDRLWFFVGGRTIPTLSRSGRTILTDEDWVEDRDESRWQVKLRGQVAPNHTLEASFLDYDLTVEGGSGGQGILPGDLRAASSRGEFPGDLASLTYQGVLGNSRFVEAMFSARKVRSARGGRRELGPPLVDVNANAVFNNMWSDPSDPVDRDNESFWMNFTQLLSTRERGTHTVEAGVQYVKTISSGANGFSPTGHTWGFFGGATPFAVNGATPGEVLFNANSAFNGGDQFNVRALDLPLGGDQELDNLALYIHDTWQYAKWRIDAGLRWEEYDGSGPQADPNLDVDEIAPRLGVTYSISPTWQAQAYWGRYVSRLEDRLVSPATGIGSSPSVWRIYLGPAVNGVTAQELDARMADDANWGPIVSLVNPDAPVAFLADDLELPYAEDFNLSMRWGLPRRSGTATVSYIHRDHENLIDAFVGDLGTTTVPAPDRPETQDFDTIIWDNADAAERSYEALTGSFDYRPAPRWGLGGNFTYSRTEGNYDGADVLLLGTAIGTYERSRPEDAAVPSGDLEGDTRVRINLWSDYRFDFSRAGSLVVGGIGRFGSGQAWDRWALVPFADDPGYLNEVGLTYSHIFGGRGSNTYDDSWSLDVSGRYQFPIRNGLDGWIKGTVLNVFNNDALIAFDRTGGFAAGVVDCPGCVADTANNLTWQPGANFGNARSPEDYQTPRSFLFELGISF